MAAAALPLLLATLFALASRSCSSPASAPQSSPPSPAPCPNFITFDSFRRSPPPHNNATLHFLVPWKVGFLYYVTVQPSSCNMTGYSVEVFRRALGRMRNPGPPDFRFVLFGNGEQTPSYNTMIDMVQNKTVDGLVADVTITSARMAKVGFTVPYLPASPLVMISPLSPKRQRTVWVFLMPFSSDLWLILLAIFVCTGAAIYLLEDRNPDFFVTSQKMQKQMVSIDNRSHFEQDVSSLQALGPPIYDQSSHLRRILNAYWFTSLCIFQAQQESVRTHLGRIVTVIWLFAMVILNASYTASLASFLSDQKRHPTIEGFQALLSNPNISVGYQQGSFMQSYMTRLNLQNHKIIPLTSPEQFTDALHIGNDNPGGVGAVLDQLSFVTGLLQKDCDITKSSRPDDNLPSFGGFGYAFRHGDPLIDRVSKMIVQLGEEGTLKELQKDWHVHYQTEGECSQNTGTSNLTLRSFVGLFAIVAATYIICIMSRLFSRAMQLIRGTVSHSVPCFQRESTIDRDKVGMSLSRRHTIDKGKEDLSLSTSSNKNDCDPIEITFQV